MALIKCPECEKDVSDKAISCPHCGLPISSQIHLQHNNSNINVIKQKKQVVKKTPVWVIILCILAGLMYMFWFFFIMGWETDNTKSSYSYDTYDSNNIYTESTTESKIAWYEQRNNDLNITVTDVYSNSFYTVCEGTIKNNGTTKYEYIKIKGSFMDKKGEILDTDWTYGIGAEGLYSGESTSFRLSVDKNSSIVDCKITYLSD